MLQIAIVEDEPNEAEALKSHVLRFSRESGEDCQVDIYSDGLAFLDRCQHTHDVIFMDIEMPHLSGMDTARRLRALNEEVPLVFVTNMKQFAVEGYAVSALDYILKPVNYYRLAAVLKKVSRNILRGGASKCVRTRDGVILIRLDHIRYVEVAGRDIIYHTETQNISTHGRLKDLEDELAPYGFVRCSNYCLVSLRHITALEKDTLFIGEDKLTVSQRRRRNLLRAMGLYMGEK